MIPFKHLYREIKLGVKNLVLRSTRSLLTMLGMVFGVGSVIAMLAVGEGASKEALEQIRMLGSNNIMVYSVKPSEEGGQQFGTHQASSASSSLSAPRPSSMIRSSS